MGVGFHGVEGAQEGDPVGFVHFLAAAADFELRNQEVGIGLDPLDVAAQLHEAPAFVVVHRGFGQAAESDDLRFGAGVKLAGLIAPDFGHVQLLQLQVGGVEAGPDLGADAVAGVAGVFAALGEAGQHRRLVGTLEGHIVGQGERVG